MKTATSLRPTQPGDELRLEDSTGASGGEERNAAGRSPGARFFPRSPASADRAGAVNPHSGRKFRVLDCELPSDAQASDRSADSADMLNALSDLRNLPPVQFLAGIPED